MRLKKSFLIVGLCLITSAAQAQLVNCSQTVGTAAAPVSFGTGKPSKHLEICNSHASNTLGVNYVGGTAVIGAAGTQTLAPGACKVWDDAALPAAVSVIGSATSTTTTCAFY